MTRCLNREGRRRQREVVSEKDLPPATLTFARYFFLPDYYSRLQG